MKRVILVCGIFMWSSLLFSQEYIYRQFTTQNGLPTKTIYEIFCAADGFIWMGSDIGLIRYDGREFKLFTTDDGLPDTEVLHVFGDSENRIWGITFSNRIFYIQNEKVFTRNEAPFLKQIDSLGEQRNATVDYDFYQSGEIFFYLYNRILQVSGDTIKDLSPTGKEPINLRNVFCINGRFYAVSELADSKQVLQLKGEKFVRTADDTLFTIADCHTADANYYLRPGAITNDAGKATVYPEPEWYEDTYYSNLFTDTKGLFWYYTDNKGVKIYAENRWNTIFENFRITNVSQDFEGNYWLSTASNGVLFLESSFLNKIHLIRYNDNTIRSVTSLFIDAEHRIYTGDEFSILTVYEDTQTMTAFQLTDGIRYCRVLNIQSIHTLFLTTDAGVFEMEYQPGQIITRNRPVPQASGKALSIVDENTLFLASSGGLQQLVRTASGWKSDLIYKGRSFACITTPDSTTWFTTQQGLYAFNGKQVIAFDLPEIRDLRIIDLLYNPVDQTLLLASDGNGIFLFSMVHKTIARQITETDGLSTNLCRKMQLVGDTLYVATPNGLNRIKLEPGHPVVLPVYDRKNGLPSDDVKCFFIQGSTLAVGGDFGVLVWENFLSPVETIPPKLHITKIKTDKGVFTPGEKIIASYQTGILQILYSAIRYISAPPFIEYRVDNFNWQVHSGGILEIRNLSPGKHTIACRIQGQAGTPPVMLHIFISAPFYEQSWFLPLLIICIALAFAAGIIRWLNIRKKKAIEKSQLNEKLIFAEQQALQAMMNPHFIFNAINSVQQFIIRNDQKEANRYLTQFARLIRSNLETSKKKYITLEEETERLSLYLQFEKIRFGDKLNYAIVISPGLEADRIYIPSMVIQPFVENAIWHGIAPVQKKGQVTVAFSVENNQLIISIEDNGAGYNPKTGDTQETDKTSLGMHITRKRLQLLSEDSGMQHYFGIRARMTDNGTPEGTTVTITLPLLWDAIH